MTENISMLNKTIIFRGNHWDKTIIRYANPQATMLAEVVATFLEHLNSSRGNDDVKTSLYAISSRMKSLKKERINDTISHEEAQRSENKIVLSLNSLIFDYFQV